MTLHLSEAAVPAMVRRPSDREPISDLDQAVWRLVQYREDPRNSPEAILLASRVVADIYWISDADLLKRVMAQSRRIGG